MKAFRGPKAKIVRRFGANIFENPKYDRILENRPSLPGQHGHKKRRAKFSEFGKQLQEKQKLKFMYGMTERQFRAYYNKSAKLKGATGVNLLQMLERRLDNVAFRSGLAVSRAQARQLVSHAHLIVNDRKVDIPSFLVSPGDVISLHVKDVSQKLAKRYIDENNWRTIPVWLNVDKETPKIEFVRIPQRDEIPILVDEQLIVEHYSK